MIKIGLATMAATEIRQVLQKNYKDLGRLEMICFTGFKIDLTKAIFIQSNINGWGLENWNTHTPSTQIHNLSDLFVDMHLFLQHNL